MIFSDTIIDHHYFQYLMAQFRPFVIFDY